MTGHLKRLRDGRLGRWSSPAPGQTTWYYIIIIIIIMRMFQNVAAVPEKIVLPDPM